MLIRSYLGLVLCLETARGFLWFRPRYQIIKEGVYDGETYFIPWDDYIHYPNQVRDWPAMLNPKSLPKEVNGTAVTIPPYSDTPDFRMPEHPYHPQNEYFKEASRYYRITPGHLATWQYWNPHENVENLNCYCVTVYKRLTNLAMGAVISYRNLITTAMSTDMILSRYKHKKTLQNILGAWYQSDKVWKWHTNNSFYMTPARIIYHPRWSGPENVNRSHPLPCVFDLALWTSTYRFWHDPNHWWYAENMGYVGYGYVTSFCYRFSNRKGGDIHPLPHARSLFFVVTTQAVWDNGRIPFPWFRYAVRYVGGKGYIEPCPKTDWEWFICLESRGPIMRLGAEPGSPAHIYFRREDVWERKWRRDGLAGLNSFAMKLRSRSIVNYFTLLDRWPVLDWLYDAIKGRIAYEYLDVRFESLPNRAVGIKGKGGQWVPNRYPSPSDHQFSYFKYEPIYW